MTKPPSPHRAPDDDAPPAPSGVELAPGIVVPESALGFAAVRSSGPGGQNVNKVSTKAELRVIVADLPMAEWARRRLIDLAGRKVSSDGVLMIAADEHRSQVRNKSECLARLRELLVQAMTRPKPRVKTKPTKSSQRRRVDDKKARGRIKSDRRVGGDD
ncbi:MAG: alternative ribosome rescue aminoacyl-tRNA hydrolase ArfB [Phycisphaerales bacterium]